MVFSSYKPEGNYLKHFYINLGSKRYIFEEGEYIGWYRYK